MNILVLVLIIALASFIQSSAGFGFSMVALSLMIFFLPMLQSSIIALFAMVPLTLFIAIKNNKNINWKIFVIPFVSSLVTTQIGIKLLMVTDNALLLKLLGALLVCISLFSFLTKSQLKINATIPVQIFFGTLSGLFSGLFNIGGPPIAMYMYSASKSKEEYNSTLQIFFLASTLIAVVTHLIYGNVTPEILTYSAYAYIGVFVGTFLGTRLFNKLSSEKIGKLVYGVMMMMGCIVLMHG